MKDYIDVESKKEDKKKGDMREDMGGKACPMCGMKGGNFKVKDKMKVK
jgi:hypothetical protein